MEFGKKIKMLREARGLTLENVGKAAGVSKSTVRRWETGEIENVRQDKITRLAAILGTTPEDLLDWDKNFVYCSECGLSYSLSDEEQVNSHKHRHAAWKRAVLKFGFCWANILREERKADARNRIDSAVSDEEYIDARTVEFKALFSRSLEASGYSPRHLSFEEYVAALLNQQGWRGKIPASIYDQFVDRYGKNTKIPSGTYYYPPARNVVTLSGRDGSIIEKHLDDQQFAAVKTLVEQLPETE